VPFGARAAASRGEPVFVSVVIPTHNRAELLLACLESLASVDYPEDRYELIVVDAASSDDTPERVTAFAQRARSPRTLTVTARTSDANRARNAGLNAARGELLILVDDDAIVPAGWMSAMVAGALRWPAADCFGGPVVPSYEANPPRTCAQHELAGAAFDEGPREREVDEVWGGNMAIRPSALARIGPFRAGLRFQQEWEWERRLLAAGGRMVYLPDAWLWHRRRRADLRLAGLMREFFLRGYVKAGLGHPVVPAVVSRRAVHSLVHGATARCAQGLTEAARDLGLMCGARVAGWRASCGRPNVRLGAHRVSGSSSLHLLEVGVRWPPETFIQNKLSRLAARGMRVTVASSMAPDHPAQALAGIDLVRMPYWKESRLSQARGAAQDAMKLLIRRPARLRAALRAAAGPLCPPRLRHPWGRLKMAREILALARLEPDIVHFEWESAALRFLPLTELFGCPMVMSCRGGNISIGPHSQTQRHWVARLPVAFRSAAAVHCVSDATRERALLHGLPAAKASVIRPALDADFFCPAADAATDDQGVLRLVDVGWLLWLKGWEYALEVIARLVADGIPVRFEIVAKDPDPDYHEPSDRVRIEHTIEDLGLEDHVRVHGRASAEQVREHLRRAHVLLHASLTEGIPNAVLEAMACAVPVVVTDAGGTREAVRDGVEGFVRAPRDVAGLAEAVKRLWRDPELRRRMGAAGRARVTSEFSLADQVHAFEELYSAVANGTEPAADVARGCPPNVPRAVIAEAFDPHVVAPASTGHNAHNRTAKRLRIISVDQLEWMQGFEHALCAVRMLRDAGIDCEYTILGDGGYLTALRFARHQLQLEDCVRLPGAPSSRLLHQQLRSADVFLSAAVVDGLPPNVPLAMASGLPIVMSEPGPVGELSVTEDAGFVVQRRNAEALAHSLGLLARSPELRRRLGDAARRRAAG
jgi:glycosyltransferase involved in cell wall biosynthesis/GT2 family glycosyltransferase